jgi:hypothetical protein
MCHIYQHTGIHKGMVCFDLEIYQRKIMNEYKIAMTHREYLFALSDFLKK